MSLEAMRENHPLGTIIKIGVGDENDEFFYVVGHKSDGIYVADDPKTPGSKPRNQQFIKLMASL